MEIKLSAQDSIMNDVIQSELKTDEDRRLWNKIILNSCYYPLANENFVFFNPEIVNEITKQSKELLK